MYFCASLNIYIYLDTHQIAYFALLSGSFDPSEWISLKLYKSPEPNKRLQKSMYILLIQLELCIHAYVGATKYDKYDTMTISH